MREVFQQELAEVQDSLVQIAEEVASAMQQAATAFRKSDVDLAEQVISNDDRIDELAAAVDELSITILASQQPVARDLRVVVSALRISSSLERMGDLASHVAQLARYRYPEKVVPKPLRDTFKEMGELDVIVAKKTAQLLATEELTLSGEIKDLDDHIDALHERVFKTLMAEDWQASPVDTMDVTLASRYHERFADHAVSIAQKVTYLATGDWTEDEA